MNGNEITPGVSSPKTILIVDDTPENLRVLLELLKQQGYKARAVPNGRLALQAAANEPPDLILLDIMMPEMDGYEVCRRLKQDDKLREIPVIFLSALGETLDKVRAFDVGGVDYVTKPFQIEEVRARVEIHLRLRRLQVQLEAHNRQLQDRVDEQVREISDSQMATIVALARLAESRDKGTGKHIERVQIYCRLLASRLREHSDRPGRVNEAFIENIFRASRRPIPRTDSCAWASRSRDRTMSAGTAPGIPMAWRARPFLCPRGSWRWRIPMTPPDRGVFTNPPCPTPNAVPPYTGAVAVTSIRWWWRRFGRWKAASAKLLNRWTSRP